MMVQVVAEVTLGNVTTEPATVHADEVLEVYGNPELAVAVSVNVVPPTWVCGSGEGDGLDGQRR